MRIHRLEMMIISRIIIITMNILRPMTVLMTESMTGTKVVFAILFRISMTKKLSTQLTLLSRLFVFIKLRSAFTSMIQNVIAGLIMILKL